MNWKGVASFGLALSCGLAFGQGPADPLYITANGGSELLAVRGATETLHYTAFGAEGPIAVNSSIVTTGIQPGTYGGSYNLKGSYTGGFYASQLGATAMDGTSDGSSNYEIDSNGYVYRTDLNFQSPTQLFWAGSNASGIAYDFNNNTLWVDVNGFFTDFTMAGVASGGFQTSITQYSALAMDPNSSDVWAGTDSGGGSYLTEFGPKGAVLAFDDLGATTIEGMEFSTGLATPEPQTWAPCVLGVLMFARRKRSSRSSIRFSRNGG